LQSSLSSHPEPSVSGAASVSGILQLESGPPDDSVGHPVPKVKTKPTNRAEATTNWGLERMANTGFGTRATKY